jgi:hypothetical protein
VFAIAAVNGAGCRELTYAIQAWLDAHPAAPAPDETSIESEPLVVSPAPVRARRRKPAS